MSRIQPGSSFIAEIWSTTSRLSPLLLLNEYLSSEPRNPNLYSSLMLPTWAFRSVSLAVLASSGSGLERQLAGRGVLLHLVLVPGRLGVLGADPVVPLALEDIDELGAAALDDPATEEDVDETRLDVVQDALIVGDDQDAGRVLGGHPVDPLGDDAHGVDVEAAVGLVEDRECGAEHRQLQPLGPLLLAARETLVQVAAGEFGIHAQLVHLR